MELLAQLKSSLPQLPSLDSLPLLSSSGPASIQMHQPRADVMESCRLRVGASGLNTNSPGLTGLATGIRGGATGERVRGGSGSRVAVMLEVMIPWLRVVGVHSRTPLDNVPS